MNKLLLHTHSGIGDHIICNGMVHSYAEKYDIVYVPHLKMYGESVRTLYDGFSKIIPVEFPNIDLNRNRHLLQDFAIKNNAEMISIADPDIQYSNHLRILEDGNAHWVTLAIGSDRQFYELADLTFSTRYNKCHIPENTIKSEELYVKLSNKKPYVLVHRYSSGRKLGYPLVINTHLNVVEITENITNNIFDYLTLIKNANEIHVVPSSIGCLVDSIATKIKAKLFFHNVKCSVETQVNCKWNNFRWIVVDYNRKFSND